jgi:hypothetical protein
MSDKDTKKIKNRLEQTRDDALVAMAQYADNPGDAASFEYARMTYSEAVRSIKDLPDTRVSFEPNMYDVTSRNSFFVDIAAASSPTPVHGVTQHDALDRLTKHQTVDVDHRRTSQNASALYKGQSVGAIFNSSAGGPLSQRDLTSGNLVSGGFGTFTPPAWLESAWVAATRATSVFARITPTFDLPDGCESISVPRVLTSSDVGPQDAEDTPPEGQGIVATDYITSPVRILGGISLISQTLFDRGPLIDEIIINDAAAGYAESLDQELLVGTGLGNGITGQLLGLLNIPNICTQTYTATGTSAGRVHAISQVAATVATNRRRSPGCIFLYGPRWFELAGTVTGASNDELFLRPGLGYDLDGGQYAQSSDPVGPLLGLPVYLPYAVGFCGAEDTQDAAFVVRPQDFILWESPAPSFSWMPETYGAQLTVTFQWHTYVAAQLNRFPYGIGITQGTGWTF